MEKQDPPKIAAFNCPNCGAAAAANSPSCAYCDSPLYSHVCPNCFCVVGINMSHCPNCGFAVMAARRVSKKDLKCPVCANTLEIHVYDTNKIYACPKCGGIWLDHDSLHFICDFMEMRTVERGQILPDLKAPTAGKPRRAYIPCPECGKIMNSKQFARGSGIIIDYCREHGNWFDWQELSQAVEFIQKGGMNKSLRLEIERLKEDTRRERDVSLYGSSLKKYISDPKFKTYQQ